MVAASTSNKRMISGLRLDIYSLCRLRDDTAAQTYLAVVYHHRLPGVTAHCASSKVKCMVSAAPGAVRIGVAVGSASWRRNRAAASGACSSDPVHLHRFQMGVEQQGWSWPCTTIERVDGQVLARDVPRFALARARRRCPAPCAGRGCRTTGPRGRRWRGRDRPRSAPVASAGSGRGTRGTAARR